MCIRDSISHGSGNNSAKYVTDTDSLGEETVNSKKMLFYGLFDDDDIMRGMRMTYSYVSWAPWNKDYHADQLMNHLREELKKDYPGNDFIEIDFKASDQPALVKIDGNRQILMYTKNTKDVEVRIEDLRHKLASEWKKD